MNKPRGTSMVNSFHFCKLECMDVSWQKIYDKKCPKMVKSSDKLTIKIFDLEIRLIID